MVDICTGMASALVFHSNDDLHTHLLAMDTLEPEVFKQLLPAHLQHAIASSTSRLTFSISHNMRTATYYDADGTYRRPTSTTFTGRPRANLSPAQAGARNEYLTSSAMHHSRQSQDHTCEHCNGWSQHWITSTSRDAPH